MSKKLFLSIGMFAACSVLIFFYLNSQKLDPFEYERQFKAACQLLFDGNDESAITIFERLLASNDQFPAVYFNLGRAYSNTKQYDKAIQAYQRSVNFNVNFKHIAHFSCGLAYFNSDKQVHALEEFKKAVTLKEDYADALYYCGLIHKNQHELEQAASYFCRAVSNNLLFIKPLLSVAHGLRNEEKFTQCIECCSQALAKDPKNPEAYFCYLLMGDSINMQGNSDKALEYYKNAYQLNPTCFEAYNNSAVILGYRGEYENAHALLLKALEVDPKHAAAHCGLSAYYLVKGDYKRGWQEYEWRLHAFMGNNDQKFTKPRWDGKSNLKGTTVLLHAEQGLGDTLHFMRYAQTIKNKGASKIIVSVQKPLNKILKLCPYIDEIIADGTPWPEHDFQIPLMSMPFICQTNVSTIPDRIPYLFADDQLTTQWKAKLSKDSNFKIGICWHVDPSHDSDVYRGYGKTIKISDCKRSVPLELFLPLAQLKGISVYSLQKHNGLEEFAHINKDGLIKDFGPDFDTSHGSFMDTSAIMKNLDLVITADTSVAHLAGGLGVPVWTIVPFPADWRWLLERVDSPWYPSMRLFRKKKGEKDWAVVMNEVKNSVQKMIDL